MKIKKVRFPELKKILQEHKLICKYREIDKETGHKTTYYIVRRKMEEEKYKEVMELNPFEGKDAF